MEHDFVSEQYAYMEKMVQLYGRLQDELSRKLFWARLQFDAEPDMDRALQLCQIGFGMVLPQTTWRERISAATAGGKDLVLYGAGSFGTSVASLLLHSQMDFYAFCDRKAGATFWGKPILPPKELINHPDRYAVCITTGAYREEVLCYLKESGFPMESVIHGPEFDGVRSGAPQYREFPEHFRPGTAIVDAGCFDGKETILFSQWCVGEYSKIYAFEPDTTNYLRCKKNIEASSVPNVVLYEAG